MTVELQLRWATPDVAFFQAAIIPCGGKYVMPYALWEGLGKPEVVALTVEALPTPTQDEEIVARLSRMSEAERLRAAGAVG